MYSQGLSIREIARRTGHDRKTIRKYLHADEIPKYGPRPARPSKLDPFKDYLLGRMAEGIFNANRLLAEIRELGYSGGKTILKDFLKPFRPLQKCEATVRFETRPGEQAQVDFGVFQYEYLGRKRKVYAFVMVLSYSRAMYVEFVERQDTSTLMRCHIHAFEFFGGVPEHILYDNLKPVVLGRDENGQPIWNERFLDFALVVGFHPRACRPYRAQTKGRVERAISYLRQNFWPGIRFTNLDDLNNQVRAWCETVANKRIHGTTQKRPCDLLAEERLRSMPNSSVLAAFLSEERKVGRDGFVSFGGSRYGVPWAFAGKTVEVRENGYHVEVFSSGVRVAIHPKAVLPGTVVPLNGQWDGVPLGDPSRPKSPLAVRVTSPEVEVRSLKVYENLAEVSSKVIALERARQQLTDLGLSQAAQILDSRLESATQKNLTYADFLVDLLDAEISARKDRYIAARTRLAHLPFHKTLDQFDFSFQPSVDERQVRELATLSFVQETANVILLGPPGVGKTHLAVALSIEAIRHGIGVYFVTAHTLVEDLKRAYADNRLERRMRVYLAPKVLIIDEVGYLPFDSIGATMLFQMVSARYERGSIILTSNKSFGEWGETFGDTIVATAILDRLLHHSHIINIRGESYRLREKKRAGLFGSAYAKSTGNSK
jgi:transposase/DNA replication protein DnaC